MAEILNLTTPVAAILGTWRVTQLVLDVERGQIRIALLSNTGTRRDVVYRDNPETGSTIATDLMRALNTANLSIKSLQRRILERIALDFPDLVGTISGSPD